jgi:predicted transcriptional regulator
MTTKERLHKLVDELSEAEAKRALALVQGDRKDPVIAAFHDAPSDDEPFTANDEAALKEADEDIAAGRIVSHEEMLRRFG